MFEQRLAAVFLHTKAESLRGATLPEDLVIAASKQYRHIIGQYKQELLPVWHAVELLTFRAHSSVGMSSAVNWVEFGLALAGFYKRHYYQHSTSAVRRLVAGDWESLGVEAPPGDLRSVHNFMAEHNRWRQRVAPIVSDVNVKNVLNGINYDSVVKLESLNWLEQLIITLFYYNERLMMNDWEALYAYIDSCDDNNSINTIRGDFELVKLVLSGKILTALANLPDLFPNDALWFSCHLTDLLYYNTVSWLDPELELTRALNEHFVELYADALAQLEEFRLLSIEYYYTLPKGVGEKKIKEILRNIRVEDAIFTQCLNIADTLYQDDLPLRMALYRKTISLKTDDKLALLKALESGIPQLVDAVCEKIVVKCNSEGGAIATGIESGSLDPTPYPLLQLCLDYNEFVDLHSRGNHQEALHLLSNIIIHRRLPTVFLKHMLTDMLHFNLIEPTGGISLDAMYKLLEELDASKVEDKRAGRLALLRGISQNLL